MILIRHHPDFLACILPDERERAFLIAIRDDKLNNDIRYSISKEMVEGRWMKVNDNR